MFRFVQSKEALRRLALSLLGGLLLAIAVFFYESFFYRTDTRTIINKLSDASNLSGLLLH